MAIIKNIMIVLVMFLTIQSCAQQKKTPPKKKPAKTTVVKKVQPKKVEQKADTDSTHVQEIPETLADSIVWFAMKYSGIRYRYGGQDSSGFDCAGFVGFVFRHYGMKLPRTADAQALLGKDIPREQVQKGDLVYFKGRDYRNKAIGHVGIVISNKDNKITFISATVAAGIHVDEVDGPYWKERYVKTKRILLGK